ncbi:MAG: hypothetical protein E8D45_06995, partial [Nitrospira sp.]
MKRTTRDERPPCAAGVAAGRRNPNDAMTPAPRSRNRSFTWSIGLILLITALAVGIGALMLCYVEGQFTAAAGESLAFEAGEVADKFDRLMAERFGDVQMMAHA